MFLNLSWGHNGRYPAEEGGEEGKRKGGGTATEGGGGKSGGDTLARGGVAEKRPRTENSDTETEAGGEA